MALDSSSDPTLAQPSREKGLFSFLRRWCRWLFSTEQTTANDAFFTALGAGQETLTAGDQRVLPVLKPSNRPPSALAEAYARAAPPRGVESPAEPSAVSAQWKILEPPESVDPVPHETWMCSKRRNHWSVLGASLRGRMHAHQALWRDDAFAWGHVDEWTCLVVADGAGSAPLARIGARLACDESVRSLVAALPHLRPDPTQTPTPTQEDLRTLQKLLIDAARQALTAIEAEAQRRGGIARDFHTTCLLLVHLPFGETDLLGALQIGDGAICFYTEEGACRVLGEADHGKFASETCFLTTPDIVRELEKRTTFALPRGLRAVALMTDGVADDFFPEAQRLVELFGGDPIRDLVTPSAAPLRGLYRGPLDDPQEGRALADWLRYEKRGSSDDRTLMLLYREPDRKEPAHPGEGAASLTPQKTNP